MKSGSAVRLSAVDALRISQRCKAYRPMDPPMAGQMATPARAGRPLRPPVARRCQVYKAERPSGQPSFNFELKIDKANAPARASPVGIRTMSADEAKTFLEKAEKYRRLARTLEQRDPAVAALLSLPMS